MHKHHAPTYIYCAPPPHTEIKKHLLIGPVNFYSYATIAHQAQACMHNYLQGYRVRVIELCGLC